MILTGMLFLLALSNDIPGRKMILYFSIIPFLLFITTSIAIMYGRATLDKTIKYTQYSLLSLLLVIVGIMIDAVVLDSTFSKLFDERLSMENITNNINNNETLITKK